jgi:hypothetical protein
MELTEAVARKVLETVDAGLSSGLGVQEPGKMCVEAAVCFALGLPHGDNPPCVGRAVRAFKIQLNDSAWSSPEARAKGMRRLAIAQLGSDQIDQQEFARLLAEETIRVIVPIALRAAASTHKEQKHKDALELAAKNCETEGTEKVARKAAAAAYAAANAANADAANSAAYAAAAYAVDAATGGVDAAYAGYAAASAAAYAAANDADAHTADARDNILSIAAGLCVEILMKLGSRGCQWLGLAD